MDFGANKGTKTVIVVLGGLCLPWACYMGLWILCFSKLAKCPLICLADLAGDHLHYVVVLVLGGCK
jgi:hypothetical protein